MKKKTLVVVLALVLVLAISVTGTLAYLSDKTNTLTNTFTIGDIDENLFTLEEHEKALTTPGTGAYTLGAKWTTVQQDYDAILPGVNFAKDPTLRLGGTEAAPLEVAVYAFVQLGTGWTANEYALTSGDLSATVGNGWTLVPETTGVYFKTIAAGTFGQDYPILVKDGSNNMITVENDATGTFEDMVWTGYIIQSSAFATPADAWVEAQKAN